MARERVSVPLTFEVGWQDRRVGAAEKEPAHAVEGPKEASDQGGGLS